MALRFIISLGFALIVAIFAIQNAKSVQINLFFAQYSVSQALVILVSAILGAVIVLILSTINHVKMSIRIKNLLKTNNVLQTENEQLKSISEEQEISSSDMETVEIQNTTEESNDIDEQPKSDYTVVENEHR